MVPKEQDRVTKRSKASNQRVTKVPKQRRALAGTDRLKNKNVFAKELNWLLGDKSIFADDAFHGIPTEQCFLWKLLGLENVSTCARSLELDGPNLQVHGRRSPICQTMVIHI